LWELAKYSLCEDLPLIVRTRQPGHLIVRFLYRDFVTIVQKSKTLKKREIVGPLTLEVPNDGHTRHENTFMSESETTSE